MLKYKKIISGVLTVALFCSSAIVVNAKNENGKTIDDSVVIENVLNISTINKSIAPYCVDENDYVERLTEYDGYNSLNIVGYRNNSGNNVINIYPYDVKYIQENCLFDKDIRLLSHETTLFSKSYSHKNASNNIEIYLPKNLKDSAALLKRDEKVVLFQPIEAIDSNGTIQNDTEMIYENAFGANTKYTVTSMYDGVGLTIHSKYGFDSPLLFDIEVVGYSVETDANGALVFKDSSTDNAVYKMDSMLAKDTNGNLYVCDMQLVSNDNVHYTLSVELVNDELVGNEIELSSSINDASVLPLIQDAPVYDDFYGMNMGSFKYGVVGQDSMFGVGRLYTKFDLSALTAAGVSYNQVISACYHLPFNSTTATSNMKLEAFLVKESWSEDTIVWDNKPNYLNETLCVVNSSWDEGFGDETVEKSDFYITAAVQAWLQGVTNNGIVIKERTDSGKVTYNTRETTGNTPYLSVVTTNEVSPIEGSGVSEGTYYIKAKINDMFVTASNSSIIQAELLNLPQSQIWELDYMGNGDYTISPLSAPTYYLCATNNLSLSTVCNNQTLWKLRRNWDGRNQPLTLS